MWVYKDPLGGQSLSPITYSDGYIYTGFWNKEDADANYVCLSVTDEDPSKTDESKLATWRFTHKGGFYWAGSVAIGDTLVLGTDDGTSSYNQASKLYSVNKYTGEVISDCDLVGDQRSTIAYDKESGRVYGTTKAGHLFSAAIDTKTGKLSDLKDEDYKAQSTSTPVVYKGKVYFATGSGISTSGSNGNLVVAEADTLKMDYVIGLKGYPQSSLLMSTAYEESTGYIYLYSTYNMTPGGVSMVKTKPDNTKAEGAELTEIYDKAKVTVKWSKVKGASGYKIYRSTKKSSGFKCVKTLKSGSTVKYVNKNLKKGQNYYYKVKAYRAVDGKTVYGAYSSVKKVRVYTTYNY